MSGSGFTRGGARRVIDWSFGNSATAPTTPIKLHLETTAGTDSAAGTDLGSTTWQTLTMGASSNASPPVAANTSSVTITAGASGTVTAQRTWDAAGSPFDWHYGPLGASRAVVAADQLVFAIGAVTFQLAS
jgi:hypothetical protein